MLVVKLAERIGHRQSLLNRLNRASYGKELFRFADIVIIYYYISIFRIL